MGALPGRIEKIAPQVLAKHICEGPRLRGSQQCVANIPARANYRIPNKTAPQVFTPKKSKYLRRSFK
jgi:hypothetical protein